MFLSLTAFNKALCKWEYVLASIGRLMSYYECNDGQDHPVFIVGTGRSGSTLFSRVMESHNDLLVYPTEANNLFYPKTYPYHKAQIEVPPMLQDPKAFTEVSVSTWQGGQGNTLRNTLAGFQLLNGRNRTLVLKSAMISFLIPKIIEIYPKAKFIHLYRNGYSVVTSLKKKEWHKYSLYTTEDDFVVWAARYWNACIGEINRVNIEQSLTEKGMLFELSYEDFCDNPEVLCGQLATFLGRTTEGFTFDFSTVHSTNHKANDLTHREREVLSGLMASSMQLKGYI